METKRNSVSERGHAKNIANANLFITQITTITTYNPTNPKLTIANLTSLYNLANTIQQDVNAIKPNYTLAVNNRETSFKTVNPLLTKIRKSFKATEGVTTILFEDFMTISRKIKGTSKRKVKQDEDQNTHSISQLSYDQRTNHFAELINFLENTVDYNPNETEYKTSTLSNLKIQMLAATQIVGEKFVELNNIRSSRNAILYLDDNNLVDTFNLAKNYVLSILDARTSQYKAIQKIKFIKG